MCSGLFFVSGTNKSQSCLVRVGQGPTLLVLSHQPSPEDLATAANSAKQKLIADCHLVVILGIGLDPTLTGWWKN